MTPSGCVDSSQIGSCIQAGSYDWSATHQPAPEGSALAHEERKVHLGKFIILSLFPGFLHPLMSDFYRILSFCLQNPMTSRVQSRSSFLTEAPVNEKATWLKETQRKRCRGTLAALSTGVCSHALSRSSPWIKSKMSPPCSVPLVQATRQLSSASNSGVCSPSGHGGCRPRLQLS